MIPQHTTSPHAIAVAPLGLRQTTETHQVSTPSITDLFSLGLVIVMTILMGRQLAISVHKRYRLHCIVVSLQRRATLERHLHRKASQAASKDTLSR